MKTQTTMTEIDALEKELAALAPLVRDGFGRLGGPSTRVEEAIRREARSRAASNKRSRFWPLLRTVSVAASAALLLAGGLRYSLALHSSHKADAVRQILNIGAAQASAEHASEGAAELAARLLDIQGLDEEGFFKAEGEEALWL